MHFILVDFEVLIVDKGDYKFSCLPYQKFNLLKDALHFGRLGIVLCSCILIKFFIKTSYIRELVLKRFINYYLLHL